MPLQEILTCTTVLRFGGNVVTWATRRECLSARLLRSSSLLSHDMVKMWSCRVLFTSATRIESLGVIKPDLGLILSIYIPVNAVADVRLAVSLGKARNQTSFCSCSICSSIVAIPVTPRGKLPADCKRTACTCLTDCEHAVSAKLCLIKVGRAPVSRISSDNVHLS